MLLNNATTFFDLIHLFQFKWRPDNRNNDYCCYEAVVTTSWGFPGGTCGKEPTCQWRRHRRCRFDPYIGKIPWRRKWQPVPIFLPGKFHGQRSLEGPWGKTPLFPPPPQARSSLPAKCPSDPGFCTHSHLTFLVQCPSLPLDYESPVGRTVSCLLTPIIPRPRMKPGT